ncbi:hypothetical protein FACS1894211_00880 [Clostridia bacterium]|nr:hypothetical protein FACS1894211_00880 [Clostridia bacterium]
MAQMDYRQLRRLKEQYKDSILFVRVGDFYEAFSNDAVTLSKELDLTLTGRNMAGAAERVPMTGVPYHVLDQYIARLIEKGYKIAIAEGLDDAAKMQPAETAAVQKTAAINSVSTNGLMIKSQVAGWGDWSTAALPRDVREAAEWLIKNGYENESGVRSAFYDRQTSQMSDDRYAERKDNAAIVRVAESYRKRVRDSFEFNDKRYPTTDAGFEDVAGDFSRMLAVKLVDNRLIVASAGNEYDIASKIAEKARQYIDNIRGFDPFLYGDGASNNRYSEATRFAVGALDRLKEDYYGLDDQSAYHEVKNIVAGEMHKLLNVIDKTIIRPSERLTHTAATNANDENQNFVEAHYEKRARERIADALKGIPPEKQRDYLLARQITDEAFSEIIRKEMDYFDAAYVDPLADLLYYEKQRIKELLTEISGMADRGFQERHIRKLCEDYGGQIGDGVLRAYGWTRSDLQGLILSKSLARLSAEKTGQIKTAVPPSSAQNIQNVEEDKKMNNTETKNNANDTADDSQFWDGAEETPGADAGAERKARLTPEDYIKQADAAFIADMRDGLYPEIVDGIADLNYSLRNVMLIKSQMPEATKVMGMHAWNYQGRSIVGGEKSLKILAVTDNGGEAAEGAENGGSGGKNYRISYVFDVSQTKGRTLKEKACTPEVLDKYFEGIKRTIAGLTPGYTFIDGEKGGVDFEEKTVTVREGLSREEQLKAMIHGVARVRAEGKIREEGGDISQGRGLFNAIEESAVTHIAARRLGLGDYPLKTADFEEFDDDGLMRVSANLHYVKMGAQRITNAVERYVSEAQSADALRAERAKAAAGMQPPARQPVFTQRTIAEAGG